MKKRLISAAVVLAGMLVSSAAYSPTTQAETSPGQELGMSLAKEVGKFLFGKGVTAIFGSDALSKADLENALNAHFDAFKLSEISTRVDQLKSAIGGFNYSPNADLDLVGPDLANVFEKVHDIKGGVNHEMSPAHFWKLLPNYVFTVNVQLAFIAHKHKLDPEGGWDSNAADVAAQALQELYTFFDNSFQDTTVPRCINKSRRMVYFNSRGYDINPGEPPRDRFQRMQWDADRRKLGEFWPGIIQCVRKTDTYQVYAETANSVGLPHPNFFLKHHLFKHPHHSTYYFTYKSPNDGKYWMSGPWKDETDARVQRVRYAIKAFDDQLGGVRSIAKEWLRIILASDNHDAKAAVHQTALDLFIMRPDGSIRE